MLDAAADEDLRFDADDVGCGDAATAGALPTVTSGVIFLMVAAETPALDRSLAEEYGRPETIFLAVAAPTPGRVSKSFSLAVFKSTGPAGSLEAAGFADAAVLLAVVFVAAGAEEALPKVANGVIFLIVAAETPAFDKSLADEYGRPAIIFLAVAAPTPGRFSRSFSLALFRSTFAPVACPLVPLLASALTPNANAAIVKTIATNWKAFLTVPPELPKWLLIAVHAARDEDERDDPLRP